MPFFQISHVYQGKDTSFYASVDMSTPALYIFHVYLVVNPKRELEFKMSNLKDICRFYVNNILYVYFYRMKGTMAALNMTMGILPKTLLWTLYCVSKIKLRWHINAFFGQKTDFYKKNP